MKPWVFKTAVGGAITIIVSGFGIWISKTNAYDERITRLEVIVPEARDDVKDIKADVREIRQDVKDLLKRR